MTAVKISMTGVVAASLTAGIGGSAHADDFVFLLDSQLSGKCATVPDDGDSFAPVSQLPCDPTQPIQQWHYKVVGNFVSIVNQKTGNCLRASASENAGVFTSPDCLNPPSNLQWTLAVNNFPVFTGQIVHRSSGKCIGVATNANNVQLRINSCNGTMNQVWSLIPA
jgi:hypothetical protein